MAGNLEGPDWVALRPTPAWDRDGLGRIDSLVPDAPWFWEPLQRFCVPECCGLAAYNFDAESVAWTCRLGEIEPAGNDWRYDEVEDPSTLANELRRSATKVRALRQEAVSAVIFNDILAPEGYASLFEDLAEKIEMAARAPSA